MSDTARILTCPNCHGEGLPVTDVPCWQCGSWKVYGADGTLTPPEMPAPPVYSREEFERDRMGETGERLAEESRRAAGVEAGGPLRALIATWRDRQAIALPEYEGNGYGACADDLEALLAAPERLMVNPCRCGHEKGDHQMRIGQRGNYTPCCKAGCKCDGFRRLAAPVASPEEPTIQDEFTKHAEADLRRAEDGA